MSRRAFHNGGRDKNESSITSVIVRYQIPYVLQSPGAGFDVLVMTAPPQCWEVKNPEVRWKLTDAEKKMQDYCNRNGIIYRVITMMDQAADALSAALERAK